MFIAVMRMDLWLALIMAAILMAGYRLMKRMDVFLARPVDAPDEPAMPAADLALIAEEALSDMLCPKLERAGVSFDVIRNEDDFCGRAYKLVCVFGKDDLQNLLACSVGKKLEQGCAILARCNNPLYRNLFREAGAQCLNESELSVERILKELDLFRAGTAEQGAQDADI